MQHNLILENRQNLKISGVTDVESFDEEKITLITEEESLIVEGEGLHIQKLSVEEGEISIEGDVSSLIYSDKPIGKRGGGFFGRMFR